MKCKKYDMTDSMQNKIVCESNAVWVVPAPSVHLDITLDDSAMVADIKKAIKLMKGVVSVKVARNTLDGNYITPALASKIDKARKDFATGNYTECRNKEELKEFLESL